MSGRDEALIGDWENRLHANELAWRILSTLNERKSEVERRALDGMQRENPEFERAASPQFRAEAQGHCNDILHLMLEIATEQAAGHGPDPFISSAPTRCAARASNSRLRARSMPIASPTEAIGR